MKRLYFLGPNGTNTETAALKFVDMLGFKDGEYSLEPCVNVKAVIDRVDTADDVCGVVPVENSIDGIVRDTLDNILKASSKVLIQGETIVKISHCLITRARTFDEIKTIISHPQGLAQCRDFINRNFAANIEKITSSSTSEAVKIIADKDLTYAAIAPKLSAQLYNVPIFAQAINDEVENYTKFLLLSNNIGSSTGNDLTSIVVSVRNKPGALVDLLKPFSDNGINLCRIESRPSRKNLGEYLFFIDFSGHIEDDIVRQTIGKIAPIIDMYRFLGSYPRFSKECL